MIAGDSMSDRANGSPFTTFDMDNDAYGNNCAIMFNGAWWHASCLYSNLNGLYLDPSEAAGHHASGIVWTTFQDPASAASNAGLDDFLSFSEMKVRE